MIITLATDYPNVPGKMLTNRQVFADDVRFTITNLAGEQLVTNPANFKTATECKNAVEQSNHPDSLTSVEFAGKTVVAVEIEPKYDRV